MIISYSFKIFIIGETQIESGWMMKSKKPSKFIPRGLNIIDFLDVNFEYLHRKISLWIPIYQCPKSKEYISCFELEKEIEIVIKTNDFKAIDYMMREQLHEYQRRWKDVS
jgi:hypothetical protein